MSPFMKVCRQDPSFDRKFSTLFFDATFKGKKWSFPPPLSGATAAGTKPITLCTLCSSSPFWSGVHSLTCVLSGISTCILLLMRPNKAHCLEYLRKVSFLTKFTLNCAKHDLFEDYSQTLYDSDTFQCHV